MDIKIETHLHTRENDLVVEKNAAEIIEDYHKIGYDTVVVTNHYFDYASEWFADLNDCTPQHYADYFLGGYRAAKKKADELGMTVLLGMELRFAGTRNDYLVYGLTEEFFYNNPVLYTLTLSKFREIMPKNARLYQAHPFRPGLTLADIDLLDGIEVFNGGTSDQRNELANCYADIFKKPKTSGTDYHHPSQLGLGGIVSDRPIKTQEDFISLFDSQDYRLIKKGEIIG